MQYDIRTVRDFLMVPAERRAVCLSEFLSWLKWAEQAENGLGLLLVKSPDVYPWVDDGKGEMRASVVAGGECLLTVTSKIGPGEVA
jgi:hypothetical protein